MLMTREEILHLEVRPGVKVKDIRMMNGHNLVCKTQMADMTPGRIVLPNKYRKKSICNLVAVKGLLVTVSEPYRPKIVKTTMKYSEAFGHEIPQHKTVDLDKILPSVMVAGECILYNSFNMGRVEVPGLDDGLIMVRDCDVLAAWDADLDDTIELSDFAMSRPDLNNGLSNDV
jgi:hypothetical protein